MSKENRLKEELGILKFWLGIIVATFLAIAGWSITKYAEISVLLLVGAVVVLVVLAFLVFVINKRMNKFLDEIERE